jgi:hypothetical protein
LLEDLAVDGTVIIRWILKNYRCRLYKVNVPQNSFLLGVFVNTVMSLLVPQKAKEEA